MENAPHYFEYGEEAIAHLKKRDPVLGAAIDEIGRIRRAVTPDLFCALVSQIISQQISTKGAVTVWNRLVEKIGEVTPEAINKTRAATIQKCGTSMRKATYIKELARGVLERSIDLGCLPAMADDEVCEHLAAIKGIGVWTAEMLMTFSMRRPDIMSWGDIAIHRGLRMLYRHRRITRKLFDKYRRRYSPHASVACLYLWEIAGGGCPRLTDPAPLSDAQKKIRARAKRREARAAKKQSEKGVST